MRNASDTPKRVIHADPDLAEIIPGYLATRRQELTELRYALLRRELAEIAVIGHRLRGTGASYGFEGLTDLGARLESAALAGQADQVRKAITDLEAYLDSLEIVYPGTMQAA